MYERFTDRARKVMQLANQEAQRFNHEYIGTEHILLGLVKEGSGVAANVLKNLDVDLRKIRLEVERVICAAPDRVTMGKLPQTPRAKRVIEYAMDEARMLNHSYVGTEHLLLGLIREKEGIAGTVLESLGVQLEIAQETTLNLLGAPTRPPKTPASEEHEDTNHKLAQLCRCQVEFHPCNDWNDLMIAFNAFREKHGVDAFKENDHLVRTILWPKSSNVSLHAAVSAIPLIMAECGPAPLAKILLDAWTELEKPKEPPTCSWCKIHKIDPKHEHGKLCLRCIQLHHTLIDCGWTCEPGTDSWTPPSAAANQPA